MSPKIHEKHILAQDMALLFFGLLLFFLIGLGGHAYIVPSEARYIEVPRQMVVTHDWLTPRINGVKFFDKPPLLYWLQAAQIKVFGLGEFSGRFWIAMTMLFLCLITGLFAYCQYGRIEGVFTALILATCIMVFASSRFVVLDQLVGFFLTLALLAFLCAVERPPDRKRDLLYISMYIASALAVMTKGLIGVLIPMMVIGTWIALTNRWRVLLSMRLLLGGVLFLCIVAPWHYFVGRVTPEFYYYYFIREHFLRFLTETHNRYQPPWFFLGVLILGLLPWTAFLCQACYKRVKNILSKRTEAYDDIYLLLWIVLPLLFFSLSSSKLIPYILPIFPPLAIVIARYLAVIWHKGFATIGARIGLYFMVGLFVLGAGFYPVWVVITGAIPRFAQAIPMAMFVFSGVLCVQAIILLGLIYKKVSAHNIIPVLVIFSAVFVSGFCHIAVHVQARGVADSVKPIAEYIKPRLQKGDEVAAFNHYYHDLPVYLNQNITVVNHFTDMQFGRSIEPRTHAWLIDSQTFLERWNSKNMYVVLPVHIYESECARYCPNARILMNSKNRHLLITNKPVLQP